MKSDEQLLEQDGWQIICHSPFEIDKEEDGVQLGFASGEAAWIIVELLRASEEKEHG